MKRDRKKADPTWEVFEAIHALPEAKVLRAAALHYAALRDKHGRNHARTRDAEENLYRQMFACYPAAQHVLSSLIKGE